MLFFGSFFDKMINQRANEHFSRKLMQKAVDGFVCNTHNAPRNADEGYAKKDGYVAQLVRAQHS